MAGLKHYKVAIDPALQKLETMHAARPRYFRWTPRTVTISVMYLVVVPLLVGTLAYQHEGKYNFRAKRRGDTIAEY